MVEQAPQGFGQLLVALDYYTDKAKQVAVVVSKNENNNNNNNNNINNLGAMVEVAKEHLSRMWKVYCPNSGNSALLIYQSLLLKWMRINNK